MIFVPHRRKFGPTPWSEQSFGKGASKNYNQRVTSGLSHDSPFVSIRAALGLLMPLPPQGTWSLVSQSLPSLSAVCAWVQKKKETLSFRERGQSFCVPSWYQRRFGYTCLSLSYRKAWAGGHCLLLPFCLAHKPVYPCTGKQLESHMLGVSSGWHQVWEISLIAPSVWQYLASYPHLSGSWHVSNTICMCPFFPGLYRQPPPLPQANNTNEFILTGSCLLRG
jgi:hypothetical protein